MSSHARRVLVIPAVAAVAAMAFALHARAVQQTPSVLSACVGPSGLLRVPGSNELCRSEERLVILGGVGIGAMRS
jgi:hypothetical protein